MSATASGSRRNGGRQCFACGDDNLLDDKTPNHKVARSNQKYTLRCCGRLICIKCLGAIGSRCSASPPSGNHSGRTKLRDRYSSGINHWLDFCRSRDYTWASRCRQAGLPCNAAPPKCRTVQRLSFPKYSSLKCPFCVRKHEVMNRSRLTSGQLTMGSSGQTIHDGLPHECSPPLPIKSTTGSCTVPVTYRRIDVSGSSELTTASVRVVELFPVANNTSAIKGEYPGYDVAAESCRFLAPPPEAVDFTLVWSNAVTYPS